MSRTRNVPCDFFRWGRVSALCFFFGVSTHSRASIGSASSATAESGCCGPACLGTAGPSCCPATAGRAGSTATAVPASAATAVPACCTSPSARLIFSCRSVSNDVRPRAWFLFWPVTAIMSHGSLTLSFTNVADPWSGTSNTCFESTGMAFFKAPPLTWILPKSNTTSPKRSWAAMAAANNGGRAVLGEPINLEPN